MTRVSNFAPLAGLSAVPAWLAVALAVGVGCGQPEATSLPQTTPTQIRAARRAFAGAPPVIPHRALGMECTVCHTATGAPVPTLGMAPANPHAESRQAGGTQNCRQCHVFQKSTEQFVANRFVGLPQGALQGDRLYPGAPPTIPHALLLRDNCLACHSGPSARPEIRCTHPERTACQQCHVAHVTDQLAFQ